MTEQEYKNQIARLEELNRQAFIRLMEVERELTFYKSWYHDKYKKYREWRDGKEG